MGKFFIPDWFDVKNYESIHDESIVSELHLYFQLLARCQINHHISLLLSTLTPIEKQLLGEDMLTKGLKSYWEDIKSKGLITLPTTQLDSSAKAMLEHHANPTAPLDVYQLYELQLRTTELLERVDKDPSLESLLSSYIHEHGEFKSSNIVYLRIDLDKSTKTLCDSFEKTIRSIKEANGTNQFHAKIKNIRTYQIIPLFDLLLWSKFNNFKTLDYSEISYAISTDSITVTPEQLGKGNDGKIRRLFEAVTTHGFLSEFRATLDKRHFKEKTISEISLTLWPN